jgi:signal transduction histidine kinase
MQRDPPAAQSLLGQLRGHVQTVIEDLRRLVYALRPPTLHELGLVEAIRVQARDCESERLRIEVQASEVLPPLPAASEVAAYRIVQETLTKMVRHSHATSCRGAHRGPGARAEPCR